MDLIERRRQRRAKKLAELGPYVSDDESLDEDESSLLSTRPTLRAAAVGMKDLVSEASSLISSTLDIHHISNSRATTPKLKPKSRFLDPIAPFSLNLHDTDPELVRCPEVGCNATMPQFDLQRHLARECRAIRFKDNLLRQKELRKAQEASALAALDRPPLPEVPTASITMSPRAPKPNRNMLDTSGPSDTETQCLACMAIVPKSRLDKHETYDCPERAIFCPNRSIGCHAVIRSSELNKHLLEGCGPEVRKECMAANSHHRKDPVVCVTCAEEDVALQCAVHVERHAAVTGFAPLQHNFVGLPTFPIATTRHAIIFIHWHRGGDELATFE